jgi:C4-dicarboxylate transporter/malic acid transport protein
MSDQESQNQEKDEENFTEPERTSFRQRMQHFTWAWFTLTMSTGGIASVLGSQPHTFDGLRTIGKIVFIFFLVLLVFNLTMISLRFIFQPPAFKTSLTHPTESLFMPCMWLSFATLLLNIQVYGVPASGSWLLVALRVLFWIYAGSTLIVSVGQYYLLFNAGKHMTIHSMSPAWILPIFPSMLTGTVASVVCRNQPPVHQMTIIVAGVTYQGLGWLIALCMTALMMGRLMVDGLPDAQLRPGLFMLVGPPSFTAIALLGCSQYVPRDYGYFITHPIAADVLETMGLFIAIFLWMFALFFFAIAFIATVSKIKQFQFTLICWAYIFPNSGFTLATINIGKALESEGIQWVGSVMTILLVGMWLVNLVLHGRAVVRKQILWPGRDEDGEEMKLYKGN